MDEPKFPMLEAINGDQPLGLRSPSKSKSNNYVCFVVGNVSESCLEWP